LKQQEQSNPALPLKVLIICKETQYSSKIITIAFSLLSGVSQGIKGLTALQERHWLSILRTEGLRDGQPSASAVVTSSRISPESSSVDSLMLATETSQELV